MVSGNICFCICSSHLYHACNNEIRNLCYMYVELYLKNTDALHGKKSVSSRNE